MKKSGVRSQKPEETQDDRGQMSEPSDQAPAAKKRVRMLVSAAGLANPEYEMEGYSFAPGEEIDLHEDLAAAWIEAEMCVAVDRNT
jgi:hypothetical protein